MSERERERERETQGERNRQGVSEREGGVREGEIERDYGYFITSSRTNMSAELRWKSINSRHVPRIHTPSKAVNTHTHTKIHMLTPAVDKTVI